MPLYVDDVALNPNDRIFESLEVFLQKYSESFKERNEWLKKKNVCRFTSSSDCLYVAQSEIASTSGQDAHVKSLGSDMMTTCHIVALHCSQSHATSLGHFDGTSTLQGVETMIASVDEISRQTRGGCDGERTFDLHIVGGFIDERKLSETLSIELIRCFASQCSGSRVRLKTLCVTPFNHQIVCKDDQKFSCPVIFGLTITVDDGDITPAVFDLHAKSPMFDLRNARSFHGNTLMNSIYDWKAHEVIIPAFRYGIFPNISAWVEASDECIRRNLSTSPEAEPDNFVDEIRIALRFIQNHPNPIKSIFEGAPCLRFRKSDGGGWRQIDG